MQVLIPRDLFKSVFYKSFYERSLLFHMRFSKLHLTQSHVALFKYYLGVVIRSAEMSIYRMARMYTLLYWT